MHQQIKNVLAIYLVSFLIAAPAYGAAKSEIAVVEVFDQSPSKASSEIRQKVEKSLTQSKKVRIISPEKVAGYFNKSEISPMDLTEGDKCYALAEKHFLDFELKEADAVLDKCIKELEKQPGIVGGLIKTYLLKTQIALEQNKTFAALEFAKTAVGLNTATEHLDTYFYPPKIQRFYRKAYKEFTEQNKLTDLAISVRGDKDTPIYINGVLRGHGPELNLKISEKTTQLITAGSNAHAPVVKVDGNKSPTDRVSVAPKNSSKNGNHLDKPVGLEDGTREELVQQAVWLGSNIGANEVVMLKLEELDAVSRLTVSIVDVKNRSSSPPKQIDLVDASSDADTAANVTADYVTSASRAEFTKADVFDPPLLIGKKKSKSFFKQPVAWVLLGVLVAGAGTGVALGMGEGGSSNGPDNSTATNVSGPAPAVP